MNRNLKKINFKVHNVLKLQCSNSFLNLFYHLTEDLQVYFFILILKPGFIGFSAAITGSDVHKIKITKQKNPLHCGKFSDNIHVIILSIGYI